MTHTRKPLLRSLDLVTESSADLLSTYGYKIALSNTSASDLFGPEAWDDEQERLAWLLENLGESYGGQSDPAIRWLYNPYDGCYYFRTQDDAVLFQITWTV